MRGVLVAAVVAAALGSPSLTAADEIELSKTFRFIEQGKSLVVTTNITEAFDKDAYGRLASGFPTTVRVRIFLYRGDREDPVALRIITYRIVYDLWDELYLVRIDRDDSRKSAKVKTRAEALKLVTELDALPLALLSEIPVNVRHRLELVIELNPVSGESLAEMRRWLTRGAGTTSLDRGTSFFGSFVSVFVNPKIADADRIVRISSQPFFRPERAN